MVLFYILNVKCYLEILNVRCIILSLSLLYEYGLFLKNLLHLTQHTKINPCQQISSYHILMPKQFKVL